MDEGIRDFASRYNIVASDKELRHTYHNWLVGQMDRASELFQAEKKGRQEGEAKGKAEGKAEGKFEIARALISDGMSVEKVAALTKLSVAEISKL
ncbi:hypothetical protein FACS1894208_05100 [Clostridia bacterium]|nr:hypothetical protein FACS1894208_05100 [Clostridia bacterium]